VLELGGDGERAQDEREDEHVVEREGLLDEVAREVLAAVLGAPRRPQHGAEREPDGEVPGAHQAGLAHGDGPRVAVHQQVEGDQGQCDGDDDRPRPKGCPCHGSFLRIGFSVRRSLPGAHPLGPAPPGQRPD
jgi:hypothetical protein